MRLDDKSPWKEQKGKVSKNVAIKKINVKLIENIMFQVKSLRDSFIPPKKLIETF